MLNRVFTLAALVAVLITGLAGCAMEPVRAWERGDLARPDMQWDAGLVGESRIRDHVYVSKEAASMGSSLGGGGCGCN